MSNLRPLEVVCRGSETQLQVGTNLTFLIWRLKGKQWHHKMLLFTQPELALAT